MGEEGYSINVKLIQGKRWFKALRVPSTVIVGIRNKRKKKKFKPANRKKSKVFKA